MRTRHSILLILLAAAPSRAADEWQRIPLITDPRVSVTLLLKPAATPADEQFIGFELNNHTDHPLPLGDTTYYRLDGVRLFTRNTDTHVADTSLASGGSYDLLWRNGTPRPTPPPPNTLPPGVTRAVRYDSLYTLSTLGIPHSPGLTAKGLAHFTLDLHDGHPLSTPAVGVPFQFDWLPPDPAGIAAIRARFLHTLTTPGDVFHDSNLLFAFLADPDIATAATVDDLLAALKRHDPVVRPKIRDYLDQHYPADDHLITFFVDILRARDRGLLSELGFMSHVHDARLIEPLLAWYRAEGLPFDGLDTAALKILARHHDLMPDKASTIAEIGRITLSRSPLISSRRVRDANRDPGFWEHELENLVLTGDTSLIPQLIPYLDRNTIVIDSHQVDNANGGPSLRARDLAYNAILDLLNKPGQRLTLDDRDPSPTAVRREYARRDRLTANLKSDLASLQPPASR